MHKTPSVVVHLSRFAICLMLVLRQWELKSCVLGHFHSLKKYFFSKLSLKSVGQWEHKSCMLGHVHSLKMYFFSKLSIKSVRHLKAKQSSYFGFLNLLNKGCLERAGSVKFQALLRCKSRTVHDSCKVPLQVSQSLEQFALLNGKLCADR